MTKNLKSQKTSLDLWKTTPYICFFLLFSITIYAWNISEQVVKRENLQHFRDLIQDQVSIIQRRFATYEQALLGGIGFINGSSFVDRGEWKDYVDAINVYKNLPGTNGIGFIDEIQENELEEYLEKSRKDGFPDFKNKPETEFIDKFIIKYIDPVNINLPAVGLDIGFEKHRREAAEFARDYNKVTLTKIIFLVQDNEKLAGFLLLAPSYDKGAPLNTIEERRKAFKGWVYSPFMGRKFVQDISELSDHQATFKVYDGTIKDEEKVIFEENYYKDHSQKEDLVSEITTQLELAERTWTIVWKPTKYFEASINSQLPSLVLIVGLIITSIFSGLFYLLSKIYGASARHEKESRERLNNIFENAVDGLVTIDDRGIIENYNKACAEIFGYDRSELKEKNIKILMPEPYHSEHDHYLTNYKETNEKKIIGIGREVTAQKKDGTTFPIALSISEITVNDKKIFSGIIRDISSEVNFKAERERFIEKLTDSNEELERFAYVCSHDLQEPLRMIRSFSEKLEQHFGDKLKDDEKGQKYLDFVIDGATRAQELIYDILTYAKIDSETKKLEEIDLNKQIQAIQANLRSSLEESQGKITSDKLPKIKGNKTQIFQLFQNLITNGLKYQKNGTKPAVQIGVEDKKTHWELCVKDNGIGIDKKHSKKIFEVFTRLHHKNEYQGTGVGLSICQKIVKRHGGKIWMESTVGEGSTFFFTIDKHM